MASTLELLFTAFCFILIRFVKLEIITDIRLIDDSGTPNPNHGRVEIQVDYNTHQWYGICERGSHDLSHHIWNRKAANVACRQLGFLGGWNYSMQGVSTRYTLEDFRCGLDSDTLDDCYYDNLELCGCAPSKSIIDDILNQCNYREHHKQPQAAAACYDTNNVGIRLVPESTLDHEIVETDKLTSFHGRLEISFLDYWYDVCFNGNTKWTIEDATVACRHMGFELGAIETRRHEEKNKRMYSMGSFNCLGTENNLLECLPEPPRNTSCKNNDNIFIRCNVTSNAVISSSTLNTLPGPSENVTDWVAAGSIIGALVFVTAIVFGIVFLIYILRKKTKPRPTQPVYHEYHIINPMAIEPNRMTNLYEELTDDPQNFYPCSDSNNRPALPMRELTKPDTPSESRQGWVDNVAYSTGNSESDEPIRNSRGPMTEGVEREPTAIGSETKN